MKTATLFLFPIFGGILIAQGVRTETTTTKTTWNGVLVDAACQSSVTERKETTNDPLRGRTETTVTQRVDCPVTPATSTFGLMTSDGRFIRFDNASNARVIEVVRGNRAFSEPNPVKVTVIGTANGDVAVVEALNPLAAASQTQTTQTQTTTRAGSAEMIFDVRHKGDRGKLVVTATGLNFEDPRDADHSRSWTYAQIKELKRDGNEIKIEPYDGDEAEFRIEGAGMTDALYQTIANRVAAARAR